ncbi:MAG TPA: methyltransferase domain-containing protein [Microbacteriaceae bacterium]|jgi:ubiquinone/menaquinone biosynthesis C-methylase UbiE|nr:methyltransferase domain-containing protein [Microbacteriaceae bacterium]HRA09608.1 methyltransferase domain-containing protein [Microbacteriaceae bacterium]
MAHSPAASQFPEQYAHGHHPSVLASHEWRTAENSAAYLLPHLQPGTRVLDVGSGPGTITVDFAGIVAPGQVVGVDASADIVAQARALGAEVGASNLDFQVGDAYVLDAADGSFDVVHASQVLHHLARPADALREFGRVAGPEGIVAAREVDYEGVIWYPEVPALRTWMDVYLQVHRSHGGEPSAGRRLKAWAREAGFTRVQATGSVWVFASDEEREWWGGSWAERAVASKFATDAIERGFADRATLERIADGWREWATAEDGWLLMPHGELIARR